MIPYFLLEALEYPSAHFLHLYLVVLAVIDGHGLWGVRLIFKRAAYCLVAYLRSSRYRRLPADEALIDSVPFWWIRWLWDCDTP